jgi:hypothetical protein
VQLIPFPVAGSGGRKVFVNPEQVVCIIDSGDNRAQIVTTGLQGQASMSLVVEMNPALVAEKLRGG